MMEDLNLSTNLTDSELRELFLEAARRANWDALHGPRHLRSGRFKSESAATAENAEVAAADAGKAGEQDWATRGAAEP